MKIIQCNVPRDFNLYDTGDWHLGSVNTDKRGLNTMLEKCSNDPKGVMLPKGDLAECMMANDPRFEIDGVDFDMSDPLDQMKGIERLVQYYALEEKMVAIGIGNHEARISGVGKPTRDMCERLGIPYMGYVGVIHYCDESNGNVMFRHFAHHGRNVARSNAKDAIQRKANRSASVKLALDRSGFTDVLLFSMGHTHDPLVVKPTIEDSVMLNTSAGHIHQEYRQHTDPAAKFIPPAARWYAITPSFLKLYSDPSTDANSYSEKAMYAPVKLGYNLVEAVDGNIKDMTIVET